MEYVVPNITYDTLGTVYAGYDVTGIDRSFDSSALIEQNVGPAVIATDQRAYTIDGRATTASFVTGHMGDDQHFSLMRRVRIRWLTTPDAARLRLYTTNEHGSEFALRKEALLASNKFDLLASARWHRAEVLTSGEMEFAGLAIDIEKQGAW
jgi:hypothetical protein